MLNWIKKQLFGEYYVRLIRTNYGYADFIKCVGEIHAEVCKEAIDIARRGVFSDIPMDLNMSGTLRRDGKVHFYETPHKVKKTPATFSRVDIVRIKGDRVHELANY